MSGYDQHALEALAARVGALLLANGQRLATAESCTGGWVAQCLTAIAGSSDWFERGFVTYSNDAKQEMLGVDADVLRLHGAVSEATAAAMASFSAARYSPSAWTEQRLAGKTGGHRLLRLGRAGWPAGNTALPFRRRPYGDTRAIGRPGPERAVGAGGKHRRLKFTGRSWRYAEYCI